MNARCQLLALVITVGPCVGLSAQSALTPEQRSLAGTWYLVTRTPAYDTALVRPPSPPQSSPPQLVPRDRIRFADGPFPVPPRSGSAYPQWVEMNPRDSISFAIDDSVVTIVADGSPAIAWHPDGFVRQRAVDGQLVQSRAEWKRDVLVLERGESSRGVRVRRFRVLKDGNLELTFPGIVRHPDFPKKYIFSRTPPADRS